MTGRSPSRRARSDAGRDITREWPVIPITDGYGTPYFGLRPPDPVGTAAYALAALPDPVRRHWLARAAAAGHSGDSQLITATKIYFQAITECESVMVEFGLD